MESDQICERKTKLKPWYTIQSHIKCELITMEGPGEAYVHGRGRVSGIKNRFVMSRYISEIH